MTSRRRVLPQRSALNEACGPVTRLKARRTEAKKEPAFGKKKRAPRIEKEYSTSSDFHLGYLVGCVFKFLFVGRSS